MNNEFLPNPELEAKNNASKTFVCTQCGECCHIREKKNIKPEDEQAYNNFMYKNYGIIYLAKLDDVTINIWPEESDALIEEAKKRSMTLNMRPKRVVYNVLTNELFVIDYFIDHDICPFFDKKNKLCTVYDIRPQICKSYPMLTIKSLGKCKYKKLDPEAYDSEKPIAALLERKIVALKHILTKMIAEGTIMNKPISAEELNNLLSKADVKNLSVKLND